VAHLASTSCLARGALNKSIIQAGYSGGRALASPMALSSSALNVTFADARLSSRHEEPRCSQSVITHEYHSSLWFLVS
jgi:hypothetical protein